MGKKDKIAKTNAIRILEKENIKYKVHEYDKEKYVAALEVAQCLNQSPDRIFKTLVTTDNAGGYFVFCIPAGKELDLKEGAKAVAVKKIEMLKQKDLFNLTGYIHGGCSPVGMKKLFPTVIDKSSLDFETIYLSAGKIGLQMEVSPKDIEKLIDAKFASIAK